MKRYLLGIAILLAACHSNNNSGVAKPGKDYIMFPFNDTLNWKGIEKNNDILKAAFEKAAPTLLKYEYELYTGAGGEYYTTKDFEKSCHILDINNDGLDDIIYTGSTGSEGTEVAVFLNTNSGFKMVLKQVQRIAKLEFKNDKLFRLYINDDGCCDAWVDFNRVYEVNYNNATLQFSTVYLTSIQHISRYPKEYFKTPIHFEVLNNHYKMHLEPNAADTIMNDFTFPDHPFKANNVVDTLMKGTKGRAIAAKTDKTGRVWWLVEIDTSYKDYGNLFYEQAGDSLTKASKMGWISSRYVKRLNN